MRKPLVATSVVLTLAGLAAAQQIQTLRGGAVDDRVAVDMDLQWEGREGRMQRAWDWFWTPAKLLGAGFVLVAGLLGGILFRGGFHYAMELTNTETFCVSCGTLETSLGEHRETIHYDNPSGVRAICSDRHVPKEWSRKIMAKIMAVKDVRHEVAGYLAETGE